MFTTCYNFIYKGFKLNGIYKNHERQNNENKLIFQMSLFEKIVDISDYYIKHNLLPLIVF